MLGFCKSILCHIHAGISHFNENLIKDVLLSLGASTPLLAQFPICETFISNNNNEGIA